MINRFTYFDFIVNIVPGALSLGVISLLVGSSNFILITSNPAIDTLLFLVTSFTVGAFLHQLSNHTVEPLVKRLFWHGKFYSEVFLVKKYGMCKEPMRTQIIDTAVSIFHFDRASLSSLDVAPTSEAELDPHVVSHQIYRRFDYYTEDNNLARKGHGANTLYSLYRTMTLTMPILTVLFSVSYRWEASVISSYPKVILAVLCLLSSVLFLIKTRREGERYVQGILSAVSGR